MATNIEKKNYARLFPRRENVTVTYLLAASSPLLLADEPSVVLQLTDSLGQENDDDRFGISCTNCSGSFSQENQGACSTSRIKISKVNARHRLANFCTGIMINSVNITVSSFRETIRGNFAPTGASAAAFIP